jgi:hypothetical protein
MVIVTKRILLCGLILLVNACVYYPHTFYNRGYGGESYYNEGHGNHYRGHYGHRHGGDGYRER